jgi:hypothetical protein
MAGIALRTHSVADSGHKTLMRLENLMRLTARTRYTLVQSGYTLELETLAPAVVLELRTVADTAAPDHISTNDCQT